MRTGGDERLITRLVRELPFLRPLYEEHLAPDGELLPSVFFYSDLRPVFDGSGSDLPSDAAKQILDIVEDELSTFDDDVVELINMAFFESFQNTDSCRA